MGIDDEAGPGLEKTELPLTKHGSAEVMGQPYLGRKIAPLPVMDAPKFDPRLLSKNDLITALVVLGLEFPDRLFTDTVTSVEELCANLGHGFHTMDRAYVRLCQPSALVKDDDGPIMYRWHIVPRNDFGGVYLHIQVRSDSITRGPHDHEYDSFSNTLAGRYTDQEWARNEQPHPYPLMPVRHNDYGIGDIVQRRAAQLHRVVLPDDVPYSMTLFCHGPRIRKWGFANPDGTWVAAESTGPMINGCTVANGRQAT